MLSHGKVHCPCEHNASTLLRANVAWTDLLSQSNQVKTVIRTSEKLICWLKICRKGKKVKAEIQERDKQAGRRAGPGSELPVTLQNSEGSLIREGQKLTRVHCISTVMQRPLSEETWSLHFCSNNWNVFKPLKNLEPYLVSYIKLSVKWIIDVKLWSMYVQNF